MAKVAKLGIKRDNNYLYYIKQGDVWAVPRKRPGMKKGKPKKIEAAGAKMETGFIYFLDKAGDIARVKAAVGGQKRKAKKKAATTAKRRTTTTSKKRTTTKTRKRTTAAKKSTAAKSRRVVKKPVRKAVKRR